MKKFTLLVGATSLLIAGCAAYFSVRGIGLLFAGFMIPVMFMAASLELGKLVTASFLYRRWNHIPIFMKGYLSTAVVTLVFITSLGIYGYLSDAFTKTNTRVNLYESNIAQLESKNSYLQTQIEGTNNAASTIDEKASDAIDNFQSIYDSFVTRQEKRKQTIINRLTVLDEARNKLEASSGGLFNSKKKKLSDLFTIQSEERDSIKNILLEIDKESKQEYDSFLTKVDSLTSKTGEVDVQEDVNSFYTQIKINEEEILNFKELISGTDIGSFKFIAKTFGMELEDVVKWFMIIIVIVFDPLAVCLVIGYSSLLTPSKKNDSLDSVKESSDSTIMTSPIINEEDKTHVANVAPGVKAPSVNALSNAEIRSLNKKFKKNIGSHTED